MKTIKEKQIEYDCIIFCDTICFLNNEIIEKAVYSFIINDELYSFLNYLFIKYYNFNLY